MIAGCCLLLQWSLPIWLKLQLWMTINQQQRYKTWKTPQWNCMPKDPKACSSKEATLMSQALEVHYIQLHNSLLLLTFCNLVLLLTCLPLNSPRLFTTYLLSSLSAWMILFVWVTQDSMWVPCLTSWGMARVDYHALKAKLLMKCTASTFLVPEWLIFFWHYSAY